MTKRQAAPPKPKPIAGYTPGSFTAPKKVTNTTFNPAAASVGGAAAKQGKKRSILGQVGDIVTSFPSAAQHLGSQAYTSVNNAGNDIVGSLKNIAHPSKDPLLQNWDKTKGRYPLIEQQRQAFVQTGMDIRHPERFAEAYRNGTIVGKVVNDIANAGLVAAAAAPVASALGEAGVPGATAAGAGLKTASTLGADVAGSPAKIYTEGGKLLGAAPRAIIEGSTGLTLPTLSEGISNAAERLVEKHPQLAHTFPTLTELGRAQREELTKGKTEFAYNRRQLSRVTQEANKIGDADTQAAAGLIQTGESRALADAVHNSPTPIPDEALARIATGNAEGIYAATPAAARMAADYEAGKLAPEQMAKIDQINALKTPSTQQRENVGLARGTINPEQLGFAQTEAGRTPARLRFAETSAKRAGDMFRQEGDKYVGTFPELRDAYHELAADSEQTVNRMAAEGADVPHVISSSESRLNTPNNPRSRRFAASPQKFSEQYVKETTQHPLTVQGWAQDELKRHFQNIRSETADRIAERAGSAAGDILGPSSAGMSGAALDREMAAQGYVRIGDTSVASTAATRYIPDYLKPAFDHEFEGSFGAKLPFLPEWNRAWKMAVLPLSPKWHIGNVIGNALMATVGAGVDPFTLLSKLGEAKRMVDEGIVNSHEQERLYTSNLTRRDIQTPGTTLDTLGNPTIETRPGFGRRFINKSYAFNSYIDDMSRTAVYLAKLDKGLSPEIAVRESLKALGDFDRMSAFEKNFVKEVIPFYPWMRHITQLTLRLPIEHPMRVAWMLKLGNEYGDPQSGLPDFMKGAVGFGKPGTHYIPLSNVNPFGDVVARSPLTPTGFAASVSPFIKYPIMAATGIDLSHGFNQATRPQGVGSFNARGEYKAGPILDPNALLNMAINQVPIARGARDVVTGGVGRYSGTGQIVKDKEGNPKYPPTQSRLESLIRTFVPFPRPTPAPTTTTTTTAKPKKANAVAGYVPGSFGNG